jgi:hypothetical protein
MLGPGLEMGIIEEVLGELQEPSYLF